MEGSEYRDPEYVPASQPPGGSGGEERREKARALLSRELQAELHAKEQEISTIDQRMWQARRSLHRLRGVLLQRHYGSSAPPLMQVPDARQPRARTQISSILYNKQGRLHPAQRRVTSRTLIAHSEIFLQQRAGQDAPRDVTIPAATDVQSMRIGAASSVNCEPDTSTAGPSREPTPEETKPKKIPRHIEPECSRTVVTLEQSSRSQQKHKYRIIIGNTSKYSPAGSLADRSTHTWLLYVRGAGAGDVSRILRSVTVRLHESYAPHHVLHIREPPFRVSRRGWGEFPASVELQFALPQLNRPATVEHVLRLDKRRSGLQSLGAETIVDVWLYSDQDMLKYASEDCGTHRTPPTTEAISNTTPISEEPWSDFFSTDTTELDIDEMIIKPIKSKTVNVTFEQNDKETIVNDLDGDILTGVEIKQEPMDVDIEFGTDNRLGDGQEFAKNELEGSNEKQLVKFVEPSTGKVCYLEVDCDFDMNTVQEIVLNADKVKAEPVKNGLAKIPPDKIGRLEPEIDLKIKMENGLDTRESVGYCAKGKNGFAHVEHDHCYLFGSSKESPTNKLAKSKGGTESDNKLGGPENGVNGRRVDLGKVVSKMKCIKMAVSYALSKIPIITPLADNDVFKRMFPFVVRDEDTFWRMDEVTRRNVEWSRARIVNRLLTKHFPDKTSVWRTKQILYYARLHGHCPPASAEPRDSFATDHETSWELHKDFKRRFPAASDINSGTLFDESRYVTTERHGDSTDVVVLPCDSDDEVDVVGVSSSKVKSESESPVKKKLAVLPIDSEEERLRCYFVERMCADVGIELRNEDVGSGYSHSAVHRVMLAAVRCFAGDLLRAALAETRLIGETAPPLWECGEGSSTVGVQHVFAALRRDERFTLLTADGLRAAPLDYSERL